MKTASGPADNTRGRGNFCKPGALGIDRKITEFTGKPTGATPDFAIKDKCSAHAKPKRSVKHISASAACADPKFGIGGSIRVVFDGRGQIRRRVEISSEVDVGMLRNLD